MSRRRRAAFRIFDADVHHQYPSHEALAPYLPEGSPAPYYGGGTGIPNPRGAYRMDTVPPGGGVPGSDPAFVAVDHLDRYGIEYAVLNPGSLLGLGGLPDLDYAAAIARATNDWTINDWFPVDERFLGSIFIAPRDPEQAAEEIRRVGANPRFVQVTTTSAPCLLGNPFMHPIYEACDELGLALNHHVGGHEHGINHGTYPSGTPTSFMEHHIGRCVPAIQHLVSLVTEGVFVKFPNLRYVSNEFGIAWLPWVMWRLDMEYRACREDVPWLDRLPSEYIRESVRFTPQPLEEPANPTDIGTLLGLIGGPELLLFSSDYPHWDFDSPEVALRHLPEEWKQQIFFDNAFAAFRLGERLGVAPLLAS
jgi:predicted TIM-barrel fold metal-dependent hydrolase